MSQVSSVPRISHPLARGNPPLWASEWGQDADGPWCALSVEDVTQRLRWIPPGRFLMGSPEDEEGRWFEESPRHQVRIDSGSWMFDAPCTQAMWEAVIETNPSHFKGPDRPVERVSWEDCQSFVTRLNDRLEGLHLSLPSESQWEYACRAGTSSARYHEDLDQFAWYDANSGGETHPVRGKAPNAWGLYDMLGNVWEWCAGAWRSDYSERAASDSAERAVSESEQGAEHRRKPLRRPPRWSGPSTDHLGARCRFRVHHRHVRRRNETRVASNVVRGNRNDRGAEDGRFLGQARLRVSNWRILVRQLDVIRSERFRECPRHSCNNNGEPSREFAVWCEDHDSARLRVLAVRFKNFREDDVRKVDRRLSRGPSPVTHPRRSMTEAVDSCKAAGTIRRWAGCFPESPRAVWLHPRSLRTIRSTSPRPLERGSP
jgi:formylglycine-generating enzyme required for sulfatase activity